MNPGLEEMGATTDRRKALEPSRAPEVVRQMTVRVLTDRIRLLGIDRSGAYEHYNLLLSEGFPIPSYEVAILDLVRRCFPNLRSYHEVGSGMGTLPLMLAHDGFAAVGVERDQRRHLTATTILRELSAELPYIDGNCRLFGAEFPDAIADLDVSDSMAILTDFVSSRTPREYVRLCQGLTQYRYVLMDLQRFCDKREAPEEQERLVEELAAYGLMPLPEIIDLETAGYYRLFESRSPGQRAPAEREGLSPVEDAAATRTGAASGPSSDRSAQLPVERQDLAIVPSSELPVQVPAEQVPALQRRIVLPPMPRRARRKRFGGRLGLSALLMIGIPSLLAVAYYGFFASSQYVTSFQFAVRGPSQAAVGRSGGALTGAGAMSPDSFVITDYINSAQAIADVERTVNLRTVFSKPSVDFWSRLPAHVTSEELITYWTKMVWAHFDLVSGNVSVSVRAFTPEDSLKLAQMLIATSEETFKKLNTKAQQDFVRVADENVERAQQQLAAARQAVFVFRKEGGLVDPEKTALAGAALIDDLRKQLSALQTQYASIRQMAPNSPLLLGLSSQMVALEGQIKKEDTSGTPKVKSVTPEALAEYQSLELERQYADKQYTEALALRNQAYLMAQNQQSYLALFVQPTLAQTSLYPDRLRAIATVVLAAAAAWFAGMLISYAVRDHLN